jgi:dTDP-glucose pyrophosphorylase
MKPEIPLWEKAIIPFSSRIEQAVENLNELGLKIVLVTDQTGMLLGTISDGDIRRGLLNGLNLRSPISGVIHRDPLVVPPDMGREMVIQLMTANKIQQVPIVDEKLFLVGLHLWDELNLVPPRENLMVIMAGGKGTRLQPQTERCPKPLLPIGGKPILEHIIERAKKEGFSNFVLAIHYLGWMIEEYFGNGERLGVNIQYLREESPLGTAGALSLLQPYPNSSLVITNGDVVTDIQYGKMLDYHIQHSGMATMAVRAYEWQNPFGVVKIEGIEIIGYEEKPISQSYINAGVYVLEPSCLNYLNYAAPCDMPTLFAELQKIDKLVIAYPIHEDWLDVGRPSDLKAANFEQQKVE